MADSASLAADVASSPGLLDRERTVATAGYNRWLVPPAALAIHLCIGMAYGFSVFWLPLTRAIGVDKSVACPADNTILDALFTTSCDWKVTELGWMFTLFFVLLGTSAALLGGWVERVGPRKTGVVAAFCWSGGFVISAVGVTHHQLWLMWLGSGVIGGIGLGLGYISPVSTLIKWFPDRRGMATGMAIMGFGGGAMIGSPLAAKLMEYFRTPTDVGVWQTFLCLGAVYFVFMLSGAFGYRIPPARWQPKGWAPPAANVRAMITHGQVRRWEAVRTPQFWLIWAVLFLNVSAGIGVIGMASPMLQEIFAGRLIGAPDVGFLALSPEQKKAIVVIAAGFTGLLSLFNIGGRFFWASISDHIGRKNTYYTFFVLGVVLYALAPWAAHAGEKALFVLIFAVILSMYGGGFSTVPAYLSDMFGTLYVGAIHGVLLTAWSAAGIVGPVIVNYIREFEIAAGVPREAVYDVTLYVLSGLLILGFIANFLIRPVNPKHFMRDDEVIAATGGSATSSMAKESFGIGRGGLTLGALPAWLAVGIPIAWGVYKTAQTAVTLFS